MSKLNAEDELRGQLGKTLEFYLNNREIAFEAVRDGYCKYGDEDFNTHLELAVKDTVVKLEALITQAVKDELNSLNESITPNDSSEVATVQRITKLIDDRIATLERNTK